MRQLSAFPRVLPSVLLHLRVAPLISLSFAAPSPALPSSEDISSSPSFPLLSFFLLLPSLFRFARRREAA